MANNIEMRIDVVNNSVQVGEAFRAACLRALERCGSQAEGYAKDLAQSPGKTGIGRLRNSITHQVVEDENAVYIGTDVEYAVYQELGTGIYAEGGGGRPTPWVYQDANGNWHWTRGNRAHPFLKPAVADHAQTYRNIIEDELKNG